MISFASLKSVQYARYLARHKWYVFVAGHKLGVSYWRLLIHDWSKFTPIEWRAYRNSFHGTRTPGVDAAFDRAWLHHIHKNPHHWNHWVMPGAVSVDVGSQPKRVTDANGGTIMAPHLVNVLPMPEKFIREMVADWYGAGRAQTGKWAAHNWYEEKKDTLILHSETRKRVELCLQAWKVVVGE